MQVLIRCLTLLIMLLILGGIPAYAAPDLMKAEQLVRQGKADQAYQSLQPYEFELSGDVRFDYIFGLAALESGRADEATLAFERVLIQKPNFLGARLDLARAWFALNLYDLAKEELEKLRGMNPPPPAQKAIDRYLALIEERTAMAQTGGSVSGYLEVRAGRDSNVNASPGNENIYIPAFGGNITLNASSVGLSDSYFGVAAGLNGVYKNRAGYSFLGGVDLFDKHLRKNRIYNTTDLKGMLGVSRQGERFGYSLGVQYARMYLDGSSYRSSPSLGFDLRWMLDSSQAVFTFGQHIFQRHKDSTIKANDSDVSIAGVGYAYAYGAQMKSSLFASVYGGFDRSVRGRIDGDKRMFGIKGGLYHEISDRFGIQLNGGYQAGDYLSTNSLFLTKRKDKLTELGVAFVWKVDDSWSVRPAASYLKSRSNVAIYDYQRNDLSLAVRYAF